LLLVLAEATAQPVADESPLHQAQAALHLLDQAALLRPPTRAYHLRRAACLDRLKQTAAATRERGAAKAAKPDGAFENFLCGQERFRSGDWPAALRYFEAALQNQPDLFWAHGLAAICHLNSVPSRPAEAKAALNACIRLQPELLSMYLLRGYALGQL